MTASTLKSLWKNESFRTVATIIIVVLVVFAVWFGTQMVLGTQYPALAVASGSMCITEGALCDGISHPFDHTLHKGDLIIVQAVDPAGISDTYPNSDIIVFHKPTDKSELIVHRVTQKEQNKTDGLWYFRTKGDGNSEKWPADPKGIYDNWGNVPLTEDLLVGRVVMRIPWLGHVALFMREPVGIYLIIFLVVVLIALEFALPALRPKKSRNAEKTAEEKPSEG